MKTKNIVWTLLIAAMIVASTFVAITPVKSAATVVYVDPAITTGKPVGTVFDVNIMIENAVDMVQWSLSVSVNPTVLEVMGARSPTGRSYLLDDYCVWVNDQYFTSFSTAFPTATLDKINGKIIDVSQVILSWPDLKTTDSVGGFDGSTDPVTQGKAKLCTIALKSLSETAYSPIDLYDAKIFDTLTAPDPHFYVPTMIGGSYNQPPAKGAIDGYVKDTAGAAIAGASVVANGYGATTDATGYYKIADIPAATYAVTATATGYISQTVSVTVTAGVTVRKDFALAKEVVHDLAVTSVTATPTSVSVGDPVNIVVTVVNQGTASETFTVIAKAGAVDVGSAPGSLAAGATGTYTITWTTTAVGSYLISAEVPAVTGETDLSDNSLADGTVVVSTPIVHDLAVTSVVPSKLAVLIGESVDITVTVVNQGNQPETFTVKVYAGTNVVGTASGSLAGLATGTYTVTWTPTAANGYLIKAEVPPVTGETDTADNVLTDGTVVVSTVPIHDIAITSVTATPIEVYVGESVTVTVALKNNGNQPEANIVVSAYYDSNLIGTQTVASLAAGATTTVSFTWTTTMVPLGIYTIKAEADPVPNETNTTDNTYTDGTVTIKEIPKVYGATLAGRSAWPEHHHFVKSKDEDGIQTLFGKVKNIGTVATEVKVVFKLAMDTAVMETIESNVITLDPGIIGVVSANFTPVMTGKYSVSATAWYKDASGTWKEDTLKVKTFSFAVVP